MLEHILFTLFAIAFTGFMANRLHAGLSRRRIMVRSVTYVRGRDGFRYWVTMTMAGLGLLIGLFMSIAMVAALLGGN